LMGFQWVSLLATLPTPVDTEGALATVARDLI
jgi:hypothetical protein